MKAVLITTSGIEDISVLEVDELIAAKAEQRNSCVIFDIEDIEQLCRLSYLSQSASRVCLLLANFRFSDEEDITAKLQDIDISEWLKEKFVVESERVQNDDVSSNEIAQGIIELIKNKTGSTLSYKDPDTTFFAFVCKDEFYFGIDFSGELDKRDYKVFPNPQSLKGPLAYSLVRLAGYTPEKTLLDPFCRSGEIAIEAALFAAKKSVNFFNKDKFPFLKLKELKDYKFEDTKEETAGKTAIFAADASTPNITATDKNIKIAGIKINTKKMKVDWLDTEFDENSIDIITTHLPIITERNQKIVSEIYNDFFDRAKRILKPEGIIIAAANKPGTENYAEKQGFTLKDKRTVMQGKQELELLSFIK